MAESRHDATRQTTQIRATRTHKREKKRKTNKLCAYQTQPFRADSQSQRKIGSELDQFEAIETLANQFESSFRSLADEAPSPATILRPLEQQQQGQVQALKGDLPPPASCPAHAPSKLELYNGERPEDSFGHIDALAINVASQDQRSFTELVHHLTRACLTDVEKARAIFRWVTVKNLNTMHFDSSVKPDTPLGLLRGIKNGSESYHVLFKRLCR